MRLKFYLTIDIIQRHRLCYGWSTQLLKKISVSLEEETGASRWNQWPTTSHRQTLKHSCIKYISALVIICFTTSAIIKYQKCVCFFYKKKRKKRNKCVLPFCRSITAITIAMETTARKIQVRPAINSFLVSLFCAGSDKSNDSITILYTSYVPLTFDNIMKLIFMISSVSSRRID